MMPRQSADFLDISYGYESMQLRGWPSEGGIKTAQWIAAHAVQPPDHIAYPELTRHLLVLLLSPNSRQVLKFAGQEFDGVGQEDTFFLLPAGIASEFAWESEDRVIFLDFEPAILHDIAAQTNCLNSERLEIKPLVWGQDEQITRFAQCFLHEIVTGGMGEHLYRDSLFTSFAIHLLRRYCTQPAKLPASKGGLSKKRLRQTLEIIHESLDQPLSLATMAAAVGLDVYYFSRLFRQSMGISPYQYVLQQRLEKAKQLLKQSNMSITNIALECGFNTSSQLSRHFRKIVGMSPQKYRQKV
ncbi:MAG: AraC family transcriptional regulator [Cyanobacteria bacterium P01_H01_bin.21]